MPEPEWTRQQLPPKEAKAVKVNREANDAAKFTSVVRGVAAKSAAARNANRGRRG